MEIQRLDPRDEAASGRWYAAMDTAARADRTAPLVMTQQALLTSLRTNADNTNYDRQAYGAWENSACVGTLLVELPLQENQHEAEVDVSVPPEHRGQGIGAALFDYAVDVVRGEGRTMISDEIDVPFGSRLDESAGGRFAGVRGFKSLHSEEHLVLDLPVPDERLHALEQVALERSNGHRLVSWTGTPPREWLGVFADLNTLMERDLPIGELDHEPTVYDTERIESSQRRLLDQGFGIVTTMVLDAGGEPAAYTTQFVVGPGNDVMQDDTFVLRSHRGRRLGTLVKAANLRRLADEYPQARYVHTWTAETNDAMRVINEKFGFRPVERTHVVELELP